jgi:hypothetical protein
MSWTNLSQAESSSENLALFAMNNVDDDTSAQASRHAYDWKKFRHFLLTSNDAQRAAHRAKQDFIKQQLVG